MADRVVQLLDDAGDKIYPISTLPDGQAYINVTNVDPGEGSALQEDHYTAVYGSGANVPEFTLTNVDPGEGSALGADEYIGVYGSPQGIQQNELDWSSVGDQFKTCPRQDVTSPSTAYQGFYPSNWTFTIDTVAGATYWVQIHTSYIVCEAEAGELDIQVNIQSGATSSMPAVYGKHLFIQPGTTGIARDAYGRFVASGTSAKVRLEILAQKTSKTIKVYEGFIRVTRVG